MISLLGSFRGRFLNKVLSLAWTDKGRIAMDKKAMQNKMTGKNLDKDFIFLWPPFCITVKVSWREEKADFSPLTLKIRLCKPGRRTGKRIFFAFSPRILHSMSQFLFSDNREGDYHDREVKVNRADSQAYCSYK